MDFKLFTSHEFQDIIKDVYRVCRVDCYKSELVFFKAKYSIFRNIFNLPFCFYNTANSLNKVLDKNKWINLSEESKKRNHDIKISSLGELNFNGGIHVANNPVLDLDKLRTKEFSYSKGHRQDIRTEINKSNRYKVVVEKSNKYSDLKGFYNLLAYQYIKQHNMVFNPFALYKEFFEKDLADLFVAKYNNKVIAGIFCLKDNEVIHYNWGCRSKFYNLNLGTLLIDYAIKYSVKKGYNYFDFGSTPLSDTNLLNFKLKWKADNIKVFNYHTRRGRQILDLNDSYKLPRKIYSYTPTFFAKFLMNFLVPCLVN